MSTPTDREGVRRRHSSQYDVDPSSVAEVARVVPERSRSLDEGTSAGACQSGAASSSSVVENPEPARTGSRSSASPKVRFSTDLPFGPPLATILSESIEGRTVDNPPAEASAPKQTRTLSIDTDVTGAEARERELAEPTNVASSPSPKDH